MVASRTRGKEDSGGGYAQKEEELSMSQLLLLLVFGKRMIVHWNNVVEGLMYFLKSSMGTFLVLPYCASRDVVWESAFQLYILLHTFLVPAHFPIPFEEQPRQ